MQHGRNATGILKRDDYLIECSKEGSVMDEPCQMKGIFLDFDGVITCEKMERRQWLPISVRKAIFRVTK